MNESEIAFRARELAYWMVSFASANPGITIVGGLSVFGSLTLIGGKLVSTTVAIFTKSVSKGEDGVKVDVGIVQHADD